MTLRVEHEAKTEEFFITHAGIVAFIVEYQVGLFLSSKTLVCRVEGGKITDTQIRYDHI